MKGPRVAEKWPKAFNGTVHALERAMTPLARPIALAIIALALACSTTSSTPPPCNENPWSCPAGQTCWPKNTTSFACLNSGSGTVGGACESSVGIATCGDGLACLQTTASAGTCVAYCDNTDTSHACPFGQTCDMAVLAGTTIQVCVGAAPASPEAGTTSDASVGVHEAGVSATTPDAGADGGVPAQCMAWAASETAQCGNTYTASTIDDCVSGEALYPPEGCGAEWESYVTCATHATYSCANGPNGCDTQENAYNACQSRFVSATSCDRLPDQDGKCSATAPYGFGCLSSVPSECMQLPPTGGTTVACCPAFAPM
jgi:hypothetical protein